MITELAQVISVSKKTITLNLARKKLCTNCTVAYLCSMRTDQTITLPKPHQKINIGDTVEVGTTETSLLWSLLIMYFLPCLLFIGMLFLLVGRLSEVISFLWAGISLVVYYGIVKVVLKKYDPFFQIRIIKVIPKEETNNETGNPSLG